MSNQANGVQKDSLVVFKTNNGMELRGTLLKVDRFVGTFEIYNAANVLRVSEVLNEFQIIAENRILYSGRAVLRNLIDTGPALICEATLQDSWVDVGFFSSESWQNELQNDFTRFLHSTQGTFTILPEFKLAVADLQTVLMDLRVWLEQVELGVRSQSNDDRGQTERQALLKLEEPIVRMALQVLEKFETAAKNVPPDLRAAHISYVKRQVHPLVLSAPFIHRTFYKPLGYAGDYEMVGMMVRDPFEGASMFAKILNRIFLMTPPVQAHRERLVYLTETLETETMRVLRNGSVARIFNLGCGPAKEIQNFLLEHDVSSKTQFTLLDFNEETLAYTTGVLADARRKAGRTTQIQLIKKSVQQLLKESSKMESNPVKYDFVYCAGLFDYLSDTVCKRLMNLFYDSVAPGGLVVATNVADMNPSINWMEYVLDWHLVYRSPAQFAKLKPDRASPESSIVKAVGTAVNIVLEVRKPENG